VTRHPRCTSGTSLLYAVTTMTAAVCRSSLQSAPQLSRPWPDSLLTSHPIHTSTSRKRCGARAHTVRPPSWICWVPTGTTHDDHLVVSIATPNLVEINVVVSITLNFQYFARLAWKRLFMPQKLVFWGCLTPKMGNNINETPKSHHCASLRRLSHQAWKSVDGCDL